MSLQDTAPRGEQGRRPDAGLTALNQAARRLGELTQSRPRRGRTRDLVGVLLAHGARAWRGSLPAVVVRVRVEAGPGRAAVRLALG